MSQTGFNNLAMEKTVEFWDSSDSLSVTDALRFYNENYLNLLGKAQIQTRLNDLLLDADSESCRGIVLPVEARQQLSGALLQWGLDQHQKKLIQRLPGKLGDFPLLTSEQAMKFCRFWSCWPQNPIITSQLKEVTAWLGNHSQTFGWLASLSIQCKDIDLANMYLSRVSVSALNAPDSINWLETVLLQEETCKVGINLLGQALVLLQDNRPLVKRMCHLAFALAQAYEYEQDKLSFANVLYRQTLRATEVLLSDDAYSAELIPIKIACLAHLGTPHLQDDNEKVERYRQAALRIYREQRDAPFPYPHKLLPVFDSTIESSTRKRLLLQQQPLAGKIPDWVSQWLAVERLMAKGQWEQTLYEWETQFVTAKSEVQRRMRLYFLERWTEAFVHSDEMWRRDIRESIQTQWEKIQGDPRFAEIAHAALLLLRTNSQDIIRYYRPFDTDISRHPLLTLATRAYIIALVEERRWSKLELFVNVATEPNETLRQACSHDEQYFFYKLAEIEARRQGRLPTEGISHWCFLWESIICLRILQVEPTYMEVVLQQFFDNRAWLSRQFPEQVGQGTHFYDVCLQVERRMKAIGEGWAAEKLSQGLVSEAQYREHVYALKTTTLSESLLSVLKEIA